VGPAQRDCDGLAMGRGFRNACASVFAGATPDRSLRFGDAVARRPYHGRDGARHQGGGEKELDLTSFCQHIRWHGLPFTRRDCPPAPCIRRRAGARRESPARPNHVTGASGAPPTGSAVCREYRAHARRCRSRAPRSTRAFPWNSNAQKQRHSSLRKVGVRPRDTCT